MKISKKVTVLLTLWFLLSVTLYAQWSTNPAVNNAICNLPGEQAIPKIATCANGDTYIAWFSNESGNYNVRLQRLDAMGNTQWAPNGILVSSHAQNTWLTDWDMTCDAANHAILAFNDIRTGNTNVVAYRISPSGTFVWGNDGIQLSNTSAFNAAPVVVATAAGNAVFAWSADDVIIMQKLSPAGALQWGPAGITLSSANSLTWPQLMPVGTDDVILKYFDDSGPPNAPTRHVFARRYGPAGTPVWSSPATISNAGGISAWTQIFPFINDGTDGFYIAWHDDRDNNQRASVFVQHVGSAGNVLYAANGVEVSNQSSMNHYYPKLALPPGSQEVYVFWNEMNSLQSNWGIFGQKIGSSGNLQWGSGGMTFIPVTATNVYPYEARNSPTDVILVYEESASAVAGVIKAMRVSPAGTQVWTPAFKDICTVVSQKVHPVINEFANNQWIAAWEDNRSGTSDIYAQNIQLDGTLGPANAGTISGTVTLNGGGGNVTQVLVKAGSTTTYPDATGFYSMTVTTGSYTVTASLAGYVTATQAGVVVQNNQVTTVNLTLNPLPVGFIQGVVTLSGGTGIVSQVQVKAGPFITSPDQNGNYFLQVDPGTYDVTATLANYIPDTVYNVTVANQQTVNGVNFLLLPAPTNGLITGTVTLSGGSGNVTQAVVTAGGGVGTTNPNASGFYTLDVPAGFYDVFASLAGYITQTITGVQVTVGQTTPNVSFTLVPVTGSGHIQGTVTITGEPANLTLSTVSAGGYSTHPDSWGNYDLAVPAGTYDVTASHPYTTSATTTGIQVAQGQVVPGINFLLTVNRADLVCRAYNGSGGGILNNVEVVIEGPEGPYTGTIVNDSLVFPHVPYGFFQGTATLGGMYPTLSDTSIHAGNHRLIFFMVITGQPEAGRGSDLVVTPNPVTGESNIHFETDTPGYWYFSLINSAGKRISERTFNVFSGKNTLPLIELTGEGKLPAGLYFLNVKMKDHVSQSVKLLIP